MKEYHVDFYEMENGVKPTEDYLNTLDAKMLAKIFRIIDLLEEFGPILRLPYSKHIEDDIFELRAKQGGNITRIMYFFVTGKQIILLNGVVKKTQKTPRLEIEKAKIYRQDYRRRFGK